MMMIDITRQIMNSSLQGPCLSPIEVARAITNVECADGIPPLPNIRANENLPLSAWTSHLTIMATSSDNTGIIIVWFSRNVWNVTNIDYTTLRIE
jgi:hypothetical protein